MLLKKQRTPNSSQTVLDQVWRGGEAEIWARQTQLRFNHWCLKVYNKAWLGRGVSGEQSPNVAH